MTSGPVLGIETSCDETSAAILEDGRILGHVILTQDAHARFGGIVPEIAARAHLRHIDDVAAAAFDEADVEPADLVGIGVTAGPGLIGALLVGLNWAKGLAWALDVPILGVHHMEAHLFANSIEFAEAQPPFVALLVSGGHTMLISADEWGKYRLLGQTRDDAAGEAFDKVARRIGLGFPGGPEIQRAAATGRPGVYRLPRPMLSAQDTPDDAAFFDFSFSGLKTAASLLAGEIERQGPDALAAAVPDLAAEFQEAVVDVLVEKTLRAVRFMACNRVLLGGGVARNRLLSDRLREALGSEGQVFVPHSRLASDNAAMVARVAEHRFQAGERSGDDLNADPALPFPGLTTK
jgi:N6-L-threonylcarbamoyladenine synthase